MIIDSTEITKYVSKETVNDKKMVVHFRLHNKTGVYFAMHKDDQTEEVMFFSVAAVNSDAQTEEKRTFASTDEKTFFEAVDYFEKLISDRMEDKEQSPPSTARFYYIKGMDSFVILSTDPNPITIEEEDVEKCYLAPAKKKFGRLDMFEVDKPQYDVIKSKFALRLLEHETEQFQAKSKNNIESLVYAMTPYQTQDDDSEGGDQTPDDVSGGDDDQNDPGEPQDNNDGDSGDQNDDVQDGNETDQQTENESNDDEDIDSNDVEGEDEPSAPDEDNPVMGQMRKSIFETLQQIYGFDDPKKIFKTLDNFMGVLDKITDEELKTVVLPAFNLDPETTKKGFLGYAKAAVAPYFNK